MSTTGTRSLIGWRLTALALAIGLLGGVATSYGQTVAFGGWAALANSASPWVMVAFAVGVLADRRWRAAVLAGAASQAGLVVGYYAVTQARGFGVNLTVVVVWIAAGAVAGPVYAAAGALLRDPRRWLRVVAAGVPGSVWIVEGLRFWWLDTAANSFSGPGRVAAGCYLAVGVALPLLLARRARERALAMAVLLVAALAVVAAVALIGVAFLL